MRLTSSIASLAAGTKNAANISVLSSSMRSTPQSIRFSKCRESGTWCQEFPQAFPSAVTRFPYHVIYLETATDIRILAVAHDRRKPGYWRERLG